MNLNVATKHDLRQRVSALATVVLRGEWPRQAISAAAEAARTIDDSLAEAATLSLAMVSQQDARVTHAGLADLQARVLAISPERWDSNPSASATELLVWAWLGQVVARLYSGTQSKDTDAAAEATIQALALLKPCSASLRLTCARYLLGVAESMLSDGWFGRLDALAVAAIGDSDVSDQYAKDEWLAERAVIASFQFMRRRIDADTFESFIDRAASVGRRHQFKVVRALGFRAMQNEDRVGEEEALDRMRDALIPEQAVACLTYLRSRAEFHMRGKAYPEAEKLAREACQLAERLDAHAPLKVTCFVTVGTTLLLQGKLAEAASWYARTRDIAHHAHATYIASSHEILLGLLAIDHDRDLANRHFVTGFSALRAAGIYNFMLQTPELVAAACAHAVELSIEPEFVRTVISRRNLIAPTIHARTWPWRLRIELFGGFRCNFESAEPTTERVRNKPPKRLLSLLKWLAHAGPDGIDRRTLVRRMWPDQSATEQNAAFEMALARLRKALPDPAFIVVEQSILRLDKNHVWVDAWAFQSLTGHIETTLGASPVPQPNVLLFWADALRTLVVGRYLDGDDEGATTDVVAEQLRERFVASQERLAGILAPTDRAAARHVISRALESEPYAERLYRALMRLQLDAGEFAEAVRTYRRAQTAISRAYGVSLSSETQALFATVPKSD